MDFGCRLQIQEVIESGILQRMTCSMTYAALPAIPHLMRRSFLGNLFVSQMPMIGKLWAGQILENSLFFLRRLLNALIEFILSRVLDFSFLLFDIFVTH